MKDIDILKLGKEFVTPQIALRLKMLGFKETCMAKYIGTSLLITTDNVVSTPGMPVMLAPTWQRAIEWLEKEQGLIVEDRLYFSYEKQKWGIADYYHPDYVNDKLTNFFNCKHDAVEYALTKATDFYDCGNDSDNESDETDIVDFTAGKQLKLIKS